MEVRNHINADKVMKRPIFDPLELKEKAKRSDDVSSDVFHTVREMFLKSAA